MRIKMAIERLPWLVSLSPYSLALLPSKESVLEAAPAPPRDTAQASRSLSRAAIPFCIHSWYALELDTLFYFSVVRAFGHPPTSTLQSKRAYAGQKLCWSQVHLLQWRLCETCSQLQSSPHLSCLYGLLPSFAITSTPSRRSSPNKVGAQSIPLWLLGVCCQFSASLCWHSGWYGFFYQHLQSLPTYTLKSLNTQSLLGLCICPSMSSLITGSTSMFTCLRRRPALVSFTPPPRVVSQTLWCKVTHPLASETPRPFVAPSCLSSLHVLGEGIIQVIGVGTQTTYQISPILVSNHLHRICTWPLRQFGLQVYGPQPRWLELLHRVDLMSNSPFMLMPKAAA